MTRVKKFKLNTITSFIYLIISILSGFVLPRLIMCYYGSDVNGLLSSITQFLAMITLCEVGVGAVVQSALYKPIAQNDDDEISRIYVSAKKFFNKILVIFSIYIVILIAILPKIIDDQYGYLFTGILIVAVSVSLFAQYYFGIVYKLILDASQLVFVQMIVGTVTLILNIAVSVFLMTNGFSIQVVKIATSIIFLVQPITYCIIVKKNFKINKRIKYTEEPIKQKWNGLFQHIATVVLENTDVIVLTGLSSLNNVSIYAVYHLVTNGIKIALVSLTTGMKSLLGDMYAREENDNLNSIFSYFEWLMHSVVTFIYTVAAILIVPFVSVYTANIIDANYIQPLFGYLMCLAMMIYMIRIPYSYVILAAGHYKQTQFSALLEAILNIVISVLLVNRYGLNGVAIGTIVAMLYRIIYFAIYLTKNITNREIKYFVRHILSDLLCMVIMIASTRWITLGDIGYFSWVIMSVKVGCICLIECLALNILLFRTETKKLLIVIKARR